MQLPNTFRPRHKRDGKTHLKQWHHNQNTTSRAAKRTVSFPKISQTAFQNNNFSRAYIQNHTMTETVNHSRVTALERSVEILLGGGGGGGLNRFYVATTLALCSAVVYTRHLFSPREGFLTHQCNISENIKRIQRWNNNEDSITRINWNAE